VKIVASEKIMNLASEGRALPRVKLRLLLGSGANSVVLIRTGSEALDLLADESRMEVIGHPIFYQPSCES
jgi:hypothetical protein